nr:MULTISPECIES: hypothetical protein [unclassified Roseateles]
MSRPILPGTLRGAGGPAALGHEAHRLALLVVQRIEELGEGINHIGSGGTHCIQPGMQELLCLLALKLLTRDQGGQLRCASQRRQRVALLLHLLDPGGKAAALRVVQVKPCADSGQQQVGEAVSMAAEMMAVMAVPKVMAKFMVGVPATKEVHGEAPRACSAQWLGRRHHSERLCREHLDAVSPRFVLYRRPPIKSAASHR